MTITDRGQAIATARMAACWLVAGASLDVLGMGFTFVAVVALMFKASPWLLSAALLGLPGKYYALRVAFDGKLFHAWAERWAQHPDAQVEDEIAQLDEALCLGGLRRSRPQTSASLEARVRGAFALLWRQAAILLVQCVVLLMSAYVLHQG